MASCAVAELESAAYQHVEMLAPAGEHESELDRLGLLNADEVVLAYLPLVKSVAAATYRCLPAGSPVELSDLEQAGVVGLVNAARTYHAGSEVSFSVYAKYRLRGEILDTLRKLDCASRALRRWQRQVRAAGLKLVAELQREPTEEELCEKLGVDPTQLREKALHLLHCDPAAGYRRSDNAGCDEIPDHPASRPDFIRARQEMRRLLNEAIAGLPERYGKVVSLYYNAGMTMRQIGQVMNVNESRICQIHKRALEAMATQLRAAGICSAQDLAVWS